MVDNLSFGGFIPCLGFLLIALALYFLDFWNGQVWQVWQECSLSNHASVYTWPLGGNQRNSSSKGAETSETEPGRDQGTIISTYLTLGKIEKHRNSSSKPSDFSVLLAILLFPRVLGLPFAVTSTKVEAQQQTSLHVVGDFSRAWCHYNAAEFAFASVLYRSLPQRKGVFFFVVVAAGGGGGDDGGGDDDGDGGNGSGKAESCSFSSLFRFGSGWFRDAPHFVGSIFDCSRYFEAWSYLPFPRDGRGWRKLFFDSRFGYSGPPELFMSRTTVFVATFQSEHDTLNLMRQTDMHTYIRIYIPTYIRTYVHTYVHTYIRTYVHTYIRTYVVCTYVHTYIHASMHAYIHPYIHTYIHTYLRGLWTLYIFIFCALSLTFKGSLVGQPKHIYTIYFIFFVILSLY